MWTHTCRNSSNLMSFEKACAQAGFNPTTAFNRPLPVEPNSPTRTAINILCGCVPAQRTYSVYVCVWCDVSICRWWIHHHVSVTPVRVWYRLWDLKWLIHIKQMTSIMTNLLRSLTNCYHKSAAVSPLEESLNWTRVVKGITWFIFTHSSTLTLLQVFFCEQ